MTTNNYIYCTKLNSSFNDFKTAKDIKSFLDVIKSNDSVYEIISSGTNFQANKFNKLALDFDGKDIDSLKDFYEKIKQLTQICEVGFCCVGYFNKSKFSDEDIEFFEDINEVYKDENNFSNSYLIYFDFIESKDENEIPDVWSCHLVFNIKISTEEFKTIKDYNIYDLKFDIKAIGGCRKFRYILNNKDGKKRKIDLNNLKKFLESNDLTIDDFLKMSIVQYIEADYKFFKDCSFEKLTKQQTNKQSKQINDEEEQNELINLLIEDIDQEILKSSILTVRHLHKYHDGPIPNEFLRTLCLSCLNKYEHKHSPEEFTNKFIKNNKINYDDFKSLCFIKSIINKFSDSIDKNDEKKQSEALSKAKERKNEILKCWFKLANEIKKVSTIMTTLTFSQLNSFNYQFITVRHGNLFYNYNQDGKFECSKIERFKAQADLIKSDENWILNISKIDCDVEEWKRKAFFTKYFYNVEPDIKNAKLWLDNIIKPTFKNESEYDYVLKTLAYKLKHKKAQHNFVFYGPKSSAKTLLGKTFIKILGEAYRAESLDLEILDRQFNSCEYERLFLNFDEIPSDKETKRGLLATIKRLSSDILRTEAKSQMPVDKNVFINFFINCNSESPDCYGYFSEFPSKIEFESVIGKRIHVIQRIETTFNKDILNLIDDKAVVLGIKSYLESLDLTDYDNRDETYRTEADQELETMQRYNRRQDILAFEELNKPCLADVPDCIRQAIKIKSSNKILKPMTNNENEFMVIIDEIVDVVKISKIALARKLSDKNYPNIRKARTNKQKLTIITLTKEQQQALNIIYSEEY